MQRAAALVLIVGLAGCAQSYQPIVDMKGVDQAKYEADLAECRVYAEKESPVASVAGGAVAGAAAGAVLGAIVGAFIGDPGGGAAFGAATGGASGALAGGAGSADSQVQIIRNCMSGRGYSVLR
jgi:outer membrane lipoprotein SlyB